MGRRNRNRNRRKREAEEENDGRGPIWAPDGDLTVEVDGLEFRVHKRIVMPHTRRLFDHLRRQPDDTYILDGVGAGEFTLIAGNAYGLPIPWDEGPEENLTEIVMAAYRVGDHDIIGDIARAQPTWKWHSIRESVRSLDHYDEMELALELGDDARRTHSVSSESNSNRNRRSNNQHRSNTTPAQPTESRAKKLGKSAAKFGAKQAGRRAVNQAVDRSRDVAQSGYGGGVPVDPSMAGYGYSYAGGGYGSGYGGGYGGGYSGGYSGMSAPPPDGTMGYEYGNSGYYADSSGYAEPSGYQDPNYYGDSYEYSEPASYTYESASYADSGSYAVESSSYAAESSSYAADYGDVVAETTAEAVAHTAIEETVVEGALTLAGDLLLDAFVPGLGVAFRIGRWLMKDSDSD